MKRRLDLSGELQQKISSTTLPGKLPFGGNILPIMVTSAYRDGRWAPPSVQAYGPISFVLDAKIFHYGQQVFEGMKAYAREKDQIGLFRATDHWARLKRSAERMSMPCVSKEDFIASVESISFHLRTLVPKGPGESLYLRPFIIATQSELGLACSTEYLYAVIASPSGGYFNVPQASAYIERQDSRAVEGGTGNCKTAGNYGLSIRSSLVAKELNCHQTLWLDAKSHKFVEEYSGMNFFTVIDGELYTPSLDAGTILPGITRDSLVVLAKDLGVKVHETTIAIDDVISAIKQGRCSEILACGTAAVVTSIYRLVERDGTAYRLEEQKGASIGSRLRDRLLSIQTGEAEDVHGWTSLV